MASKLVRTATFNEGFRITVHPGAVEIEATDYHAEPLVLSGDRLRELGLVISGGETASEAD